MNTRWLSPFVRRLALREWLVLFVGLLMLAATLGWQNGLGRLDQSIYDFFLSFNHREARDDIIIVAIDDYSISQLGRWPWPRHLHAQLVDRINHAHPRALGLDIILSEAESGKTGGDDDAQLADAIRQNGRTVLPALMSSAGQGLMISTPIPALAQAAHALGHIDLEHDSDGVVRSVYLREGQNGRWWPHFAAALLATGRGEDMSATRAPVKLHADRPDDWQRDDQIHIPFEGGIGHFQSVPYVSVLRGEVPDAFFTDKYVLVGATALGMADSYPTPVSGSSGAMPGIEINAHVLASLLNGERIVIAPPWQTALFNALPVLLVLFGYLALSPRMSLLATGGCLAATLIASCIGLHMGVWMAPSAAIIVLMLSYPLWSWRRLEAAITYLGQEFIRLDKEPHLLPEERNERNASQPEEIADVLEQRIIAMEKATRRVRDLRQFVSDSLNSLPDATLITTMEGRVLLANKHAADYYRAVGFNDVTGLCIHHLLLHLNAPQPLDQPVMSSFEWAELFNPEYADAFSNGVSVQDPKGRDLLIKSAPCYASSSQLIGWIINIIDISAIRAAERSRDETLRFLSHDMRAPQASILALLELQNEESSALPQEEFFARIEKASRKTLGLADNFVQLARAESHEYRLEIVDFHDLLFDAADEIWSLAKSKHIVVQVEGEEGSYPVNVDRTLMTRALNNLLSNAINYSPEHTNIVCTVWTEQRNDQPHVICAIRDHGYGIAPADQVKLFRRFQHAETSTRARHDGVGLGLVFVKTVVERHQGSIACTSQLGEGTTFTLALPCCQIA